MPNMNKNKFETFSLEIECPKCSNFGHTANNCRLDIQRSYQTNWVRQGSQSHPECYECNLAIQKVERDEIPWYVDSGCSKHMTGDKNRFIKLRKDKGLVKFGDRKSTEVIGKGDVCLGSKSCEAKDVLLVKDMKQNILSVSQMCDQGHKLLFTDKKCLIMKANTHQIVGTTARNKDNVYVLNSARNERCLWHRRRDHLHT